MSGGHNPKDGKRQWIYAADVKGRFQRIHRLSGIALYAILFITPWIGIGGHPALQLDLAARRLYFFGGVYTPRDTIFLVLLLLGAAFTLFFLTSLYGRLWCGFACPQTVFLEELIRPIERFWEGSRGRRIQADRKGWNPKVVGKKVGKQLSFLAVAVVLAMATTSYFTGPVALWTGQASLAAYGGMAAIALTLFFDFAWFREQWCNMLCPYARFQAALTDDNSIVIEYDAMRGEPRMKGRRKNKAGKAAAAKAGACIDCSKCVTVCPQGVDIRNGYQLECINCARCVDACTSVMDKFQQPSLVRYTTVAEREGRKRTYLSPRNVAYGALLSAIVTALIVVSTGRQSIEATVNRLPGSLYQVDDDGWTRNTFMLSISNNDVDQPLAVKVELDGIPGAELMVPPIEVAPAGQVQVPLVVRAPASADLPRTAPIEVRVIGPDEARTVPTTFKSGSEAALEG